MIKPRMTVWLPCKIQNGPFPSERRVYVRVGDSEWFGFVNVEDLQEAKRLVRAVVVGVQKDSVTVRIKGHSPEERFIKSAPEALREHVAFAT